MKKFMLTLACIASIAFTACSGGDADSNGGTAQNSESSQNSSNSGQSDRAEGKNVYEIGDTASLTAISNLADTTYDLTVESVEFTKEYDGIDIQEFVINADESIGMLVVNLSMKNTGDEAYALDMTLEPALSQDETGAGETPIEEFADQGLSKEVAPGDEEPLVLVFIHDKEAATSDYANEDGDYFLTFEYAAKEPTSFRVPLSAIN